LRMYCDILLHFHSLCAPWRDPEASQHKTNKMLSCVSSVRLLSWAAGGCIKLPKSSSTDTPPSQDLRDTVSVLAILHCPSTCPLSCPASDLDPGHWPVCPMTAAPSHFGCGSVGGWGWVPPPRPGPIPSHGTWTLILCPLPYDWSLCLI
jgi:hypothetical protein